jgi:hypothetical protein
VKFGVSEIRSARSAIFETGSRISKSSFENGCTVEIFWNDTNRSKFDSGGNQEETEFR